MRTTLSQVFLSLGLGTECRILDLACGVGNVAEDLGEAGYRNVDGMDPVLGYLETARAKKLYTHTYKEALDPDKETSLAPDTYDAVICSAGFFQSLISPRALPEMIRITKKGGLILWNIARGYQDYSPDYAKFDSIVAGLVDDGRWVHHRPVLELDDLVFTDSGAAFFSGYQSSGIQTDGYVFVMRKL